MISINEYFDGNVKSLGYETASGNSSLGVMEVGNYEFATSKHETMTVVEGQLDVILPGESEVKSFKNGESFMVDANQSFKANAVVTTSYLCVYK